MKIPLDFSPERDRISVICTVRIPPKNLPIPIKFIVDTGSPETFIDELDLARYRIFIKNISLSNYMLMAGTKIALYKLGKVAMNFKNDLGSSETIEFNNLKAAESAWSRPGAISTSTSILGMNFLLENKLSLFVNPDNREGYIEGNE